MRRYFTVICLLMFIVTMNAGCVTRTRRSNGTMTTNGLKINKDGERISEKTIWIWQKGYWTK